MALTWVIEADIPADGTFVPGGKLDDSQSRAEIYIKVASRDDTFMCPFNMSCSRLTIGQSETAIFRLDQEPGI